MTKTYIITFTRKGKCNRTKCQAACCRTLNLMFGNFSNDNATTPLEEEVMFTNHKCDSLNELSDTFDCSMYKNRPTVCSKFPESPWCMIYRKVKDVCSYWFEIEIKIVDDIVSPSPESSPSPSVELTPNDERKARP